MRSRRGALLGSALISLVLVAAACSDVSSSTSAGGAAVPDNSGTTIKFSVSPWVNTTMIEKIIVVAPTTAVPMSTGFAVALKVLPAPSFSSSRCFARSKLTSKP